MMKKTNVILLILSLALILAASINSAVAYFTTYAQARGGYVLHLEAESPGIHEEFGNWTKRVIITTDAAAQPTYVRAKAFAGSQYPLTYEGEGWTRGEDDYYYYDEILYGGDSTEELRIYIGNIPEDVREGDGFNVVVVYESVPVQYDESGNPYADWSLRLEGGSEG